jgi:hypothetical protein
MKKQLVKSNSFLMMIGILLVLTFALSVSAQKMDDNSDIKPYPPLIVDTSINPHDFADKYYAMNGINANNIIGRRNGYDILSVIGWSSNPYHRDVRILATLPAYDSNGAVLFFSPLGEINEKGFTEDTLGSNLREMADNYPIYVFPQDNGYEFSFGKTRQASLMESTMFNPNVGGYSVGVRSIVMVNYSKRAFGDEGTEMMEYMLKKNGVSLDGTPLIKSFEDLLILEKYELVTLTKRALWDDPNLSGKYAISPIIYEPVKGVIAPDAFLIMATRKGEPLPGELIFVEQFNCLRKSGNWCSE